MRTQLIVPAVAALTAVLTLTACGTETGSGKGAGDGSGDSVRPAAPLTGVRWTVESVTVDGKKTAAPAGAHVEFQKGRAEGNYGCNHFGADAKIEGDTITVGQAQMTEMGCAKDVQGFETALSKALSGELKAKVSAASGEAGKTAKNLVLTTADGDSVALAAQPPAPLVGTKWTVTSLLKGEVASSLPAGTENKAHLVIGKDGSVRGNLGCNTFRGEAKVDGSTITFGRLSTTRMMCTGTSAMVEQSVTEALTGKVTYKLDHRSLSLTAESGKGVSATAG